MTSDSGARTQPQASGSSSSSSSNANANANVREVVDVDVDVDDYSVPKPSKIKLKETQQERASRIYDQELRRQKRKEHLISRANGYALSASPPLRSGRVESITPPRIPVPKLRDTDTDTDRSEAGRRVDQEEERGRMAWLEAEELDRLESDPFRSYTMPDVHIPKRFRPASPPPASSSSARTSTYRPNANGGGTTGVGAGRIPSMNGMNDDEYTQFIRDGMERLRNITDQHHREEEKRQKEKAAEERLRREEADQRRREERRKRRKRNATQTQDSQSQSQFQQPRHYVDVDEDTVVDLVRDSKALERARYINIWQSLAGVGVQGEVQQVEMRYKDIPWPIYGGKVLEKQNIYNFLSDLASDTSTSSSSNIAKSSSTNTSTSASVKDKEKKVLRDAIRIFHPDRFFGRFLDRVRVSDRDKVKEGVEVCSRVINALAAENAAR